MKKLLIIGASILQLPAIRKAKEMGFYVGVIDYDPNAIGIAYADEYFNVSTIDIEKVAETAKAFRPDGIMTLATDMPMRSIAAATKVCGLPGIDMDVAIKSTDKGFMIRAFEAAGVEHPWYYIVQNPEEFEQGLEKASFPCIIKPTDNSGSRGVELCRDRESLRQAYSYARNEARQGAVILEEYLQGREVSVEVMVIDRIPHVLQITDKLTTGAPHFVEMGHSQPSMLPEQAQEQIRDLAERAVKAVGIENGPAHVEMMLTENGPRMIELGARMGGDCITTHLVPLSTGIDMVRSTIEVSCGMMPDIAPRFCKGSAIRYFYVPDGVIASIDGVDAARVIPGVREISFVKKIGDRISGVGSSADRVGFVIAQADSAAEAVRICEEVLKKVHIQVSPVKSV